MRIAVFGLGYVGSVTSVCLAMNGHNVYGVDIDAVKVDWITKGIPPIREPAFAEQLRKMLEAGRLKATTDVKTAVNNTDVALICVGTPTSDTGATFLGAVERATSAINDALLAEPHRYLVAVRSTIPPGTMEELVIPLLREGAGHLLKKDLRICFNPEFLREGTAIDDFFDPPFTIVGVEEAVSACDEIIAQIENIYALADVPTVRLNFKEAELVKVISNAFHALKIDFANEVGTVAARLGANPERLMDAFALDAKLNISPKYLRPGFGFGGSCLPKDVRGLTHVARSFSLSLPLIEAILPSNEEHMNRALSRIQSHSGRVVGLVGLVFKADTDDVRESPALLIARALLDIGKSVLIYEPELQLDRLLGANLAYLEERLPEFRNCFVDWPTLVARADIVAVTRSKIIPESTLGQLLQPTVILYRLSSESPLVDDAQV